MRGLSTGFLCQASCSLACCSWTNWPHKVVTGSVYWVWRAPSPLKWLNSSSSHVSLSTRWCAPCFHCFFLLRNCFTASHWLLKCVLYTCIYSTGCSWTNKMEGHVRPHISNTFSWFPLLLLLISPCSLRFVLKLVDFVIRMGHFLDVFNIFAGHFHGGCSWESLCPMSGLSQTTICAGWRSSGTLPRDGLVAPCWDQQNYSRHSSVAAGPQSQIWSRLILSSHMEPVGQHNFTWCRWKMLLKFLLADLVWFWSGFVRLHQGPQSVIRLGTKITVLSLI